MTPYIIFECGPTHRGCLSALDLVTVAATAGADAIKFQMIDADRLCSDPLQTVTYTDTGGLKTESMRNVLRRRTMTPNEWRKIGDRAAKWSIDLIMTCGFDDEVDLAIEIGCSAIKIASGDIDHFDLIRYVAHRAPEVHIDTGNATLDEVAAAAAIVLDRGKRLVVHHCPTGYPAMPEAHNLRMIEALARSYVTGYSCHALGYHMCSAAIALGATVIEKTLTESRARRGPEHLMSVEPAEAREFVGIMDDVALALGSADRTFTPAQDRARRMVRRKLRAGVWSRPGI